MKRYLHLFDLETEFNSEYNDDEKYYEPWVSMTEDVERVDYNKKEEPLTYTRTITYIDRGNSATTTDTQTGNVGEPITFTLPSAPTWDAEHECIGWSTEEYPTYTQSATTGFIKAGGSQFQTSEDVTLYADYLTTFQGLINEGYVTVSNGEGATDAGNMLLRVSNSANVYPKEMVVDFNEVFVSAEGKKVSLDGIVGSGTAKNVFWFPTLTDGDTWAYWLTPDEWYDIYNNTALNHFPQQYQFYGMKWDNKDSVTIIYSPIEGTNVWCFGSSIYGPRFPETLNVDMGGSDFANIFKTFGHGSNGCSSKYINVTTSRYADNRIRPNRGGANLYVNAAFEGCKKLEEFSGIYFTDCRNFGFLFDGCYSLPIVTSGQMGTEVQIAGSMQQMFCNCQELVTVETELNVSGVSATASAFYNCPKLENLKLKGINAAVNARPASLDRLSYPHNTAVTWELKDTKLSQSSVDYIINNLTICNTTVEGFVYKVINFPDGITLTNAQLSTLYDNGWIAWINDVVQSV